MIIMKCPSNSISGLTVRKETILATASPPHYSVWFGSAERREAYEIFQETQN